MKKIVMVLTEKKVQRVLMVFAVIAMVTMGVIYGLNKSDKESLSYVIIDINPSVQLAVNENEEVIEVLALNDDGDIVTSDLNLVGLSLEEATKMVVESATEAGYIDEYGEDNNVTITAYSDDVELRVNIEEKAINETKRVLEEKNIYSSVLSAGVTDEMKAFADEYEISYGKMLIIEKAYALNNSLDKAELANSSVKKIQEQIKTAVQARYEEKDMNQEQVKQYAKEQREVKVEENATKTMEIIDDLSNQNQEILKDAVASEKEKIIEELLEQKKIEIRNKVINSDAGVSNPGSIAPDDTTSNGNQGTTNGGTNTDTGNTSSANQGTGTSQKENR